MINITGTEARQRYLILSIRQSIRYELAFARRIVPVLDRQARAASRKFRDSDDMVAAIAEVDRYTEQWEKKLIPHHIQVGEAKAKELYNSLKCNRRYIETKDFENFRALFREFAWLTGSENIQKVNDTTKDLVRKAIIAGRNEGEGVIQIAKRIYGNVSGIGKINAKVRCRLISRTETHLAANAANHQAAMETGLSLDKEWVSAEKDNTRPDHRDADTQTVDLKEHFVVGGALLMYPGDPSAPVEQIANCRCTEIEHTKTSVAIP